jgi:hypothetical protein
MVAGPAATASSRRELSCLRERERTRHPAFLLPSPSTPPPPWRAHTIAQLHQQLHRPLRRLLLAECRPCWAGRVLQGPPPCLLQQPQAAWAVSRVWWCPPVPRVSGTRSLQLRKRSWRLRKCRACRWLARCGPRSPATAPLLLTKSSFQTAARSVSHPPTSCTCPLARCVRWALPALDPRVGLVTDARAQAALVELHAASFGNNDWLRSTLGASGCISQ